MSHEYMVQTVDTFFNQLDTMEASLQTFSENVENRRKQILKALNDFQKDTENLQQKILSKKAHSDLVQQATERAIEGIRQTVNAWNRQMALNAEGAEFMKKHQKYLVVMVFGAVKTGKSSLGNFIKGDAFRDAPFNNAFKHHSLPVLEAEESGRENGGIVTDDRGRQSFAVGYVDTTGAVQYFTLSGLRWMDSPGTGAVSKQGDTKDMDELVDKYIPYTDFCLFLINSAEPGLRSDFRYMKDLVEIGQEALVLITRSDKTEMDADEDGKIINIRIAKTDENRRKQEEYVDQLLKDAYPDVDSKRYSIFSISTALAEEAVHTDDDNKFRASHLDILMKRMGDKFANEAGELKKERIRKTVNVFIDHMVKGKQGENGIYEVEKALNEVMEKRTEYIEKLKGRKKRICQTIQGNIHTAVASQAEEWGYEVEKTGHPIDAGKTQAEISSIVNKYISKALNEEIANVIDHFENESNRKFQADLQIGGIQKKSKTIQKTYKKEEVVERSAHGVWENICSFFGRTYYRTRYVDVTKDIQIDMGVNVQDYLDKLIPVLDTAVENYVTEAINGVEKDYFTPQQEYVNAMNHAISDLQAKLKAVEFKDIRED